MGKAAIVCSVWPEHTTIEAVVKPDKQREDEWRGVNLSRQPVNVFNMRRYSIQRRIWPRKTHIA